MGNGLIHIPTTRNAEFIDITDRIESLVARSDIGVGFVNLQVMHTTVGLLVNEHEPLLLGDFARTLDAIAPRDAEYAHDDFTRRAAISPTERVNGHAHCRALVLNPSLCLNIVGGRLILGRWQRVFLAEFDGPQVRTISAVIVGQPATAVRARARTSASEARFSEALAAAPSTSIGASL